MKHEIGAAKVPEPSTGKLWIIYRDMKTTMSLLTIIPVRNVPPPGTIAQSSWFWPIIGAFLGLLAGTTATLLMAIGASPIISSIIATGLLVALTGGLHEDGLADCADGLPNGDNPEKRIEIMRDSRLGTYGVLALVMALLMRVVCLSELLNANLAIEAMVVSGTFSRMAMTSATCLIAPAAQNGMSSSAGQPSIRITLLSIALSLAVLVLLSVVHWLPIIALAAVPVVLFCLYARNRLGGQTGDVIGATQQLTEIFCLLSIVLSVTIA